MSVSVSPETLDKNHWSFSHIFRPFVQKSLSLCNKSVLCSIGGSSSRKNSTFQSNHQKIFGEIFGGE